MAVETILAIGPDVGTWMAELAAASTSLQLQLEICPANGQLSEQLQQLQAAGTDLRVAIISSEATTALATARQIRRTDPLVQILFLADDSQATALRRQMGPAPRIGSYWSIARPDRQALSPLLKEASRSTQQRRRSRTTLERIRFQVSSLGSADPSEYRRLVLSDRYLASVLNHAQDAILSAEPDGSLITWNKGAARLFGYSERDTIRRPLSMLAIGEDAEKINGSLQRVREGQSEARSQLRLRRADGSELQTEAIFAPVLDETTRLIGISAIIRDVSERTRAENEVRKQREWLRVTLQGIGDAVIATDTDGRIMLMNPVAVALTGWSDEEARGQRLSTVFQILHEPTRQPVENPVQRVLRAGHVVGLGNHTILIARDGTQRPIDDSAAPIADSGGAIIGVVLIFRDVTEQRRAEAALQESEAKLRLLADTIPQLAWMARPDGHVFWYNRQWYEYTGATPGEMEGWDWKSIHDPTILPTVIQRWQASIDQGEPFDMVFPLKGADGQFRPFLTRVNPLRGPDGRILYWFGSNTDISEIKAMEQALREADRRKDEFLATLAHELRNPLAPLRNCLEILKMPGIDSASATMSVEVMERQVHHLSRLVDDLLDVSRVMRGKVELRKEPVELASVISRGVETAEPLINSREHELTVSLPPQDLLLEADPVRATQIIGNLLANAARYTDPGGRICVQAYQDGAQVVIKVQDNGRGIDPEILPKIFDLFVQAPEAGARAHEGLGIGLTLVKNLLEMHGGTIEAHSEGLGKGSEFTLRLPLLRTAKQLDKKTEALDQPPDRPPARHRLLVIDDNQDAADSLATWLQLQGHEVRIVNDGPSALAIINAFRPDLVFLDIGMPGMDGYEVARRIRQQPCFKNLTLVALTGWGQEEDRRRTAQAGFHHHLVKPVAPASLNHLFMNLKQTKQG